MSLPRAMLAAALPALQQAVQDQDPDVRRMAAAICRQIE